MRPPYRDQYGTLNVVDKPRQPGRFELEVDEKVARSEGVGGWQHGPVFICDQANEETVDIPAWLRGLDEFPKPAGAQERIARIHRKAAELFDEIEELKGLYG